MVKSLPTATFCPGWKLAPRCRTMIVPGVTYWSNQITDICQFQKCVTRAFRAISQTYRHIASHLISYQPILYHSSTFHQPLSRPIVPGFGKQELLKTGVTISINRRGEKPRGEQEGVCVYVQEGPAKSCALICETADGIEVGRGNILL